MSKDWGLFPSNWWSSVDSAFNLLFDNKFDASIFATKGYPVNVLYNEKEKQHVIEVALAGVAKDRVKVEVENGQNKLLTISVTEKQEDASDKEVVYKRTSSKSWSYSYVINSHNSDKVTAKLEDGLLTVTVPIAEVESEKREVLIG